MGMLLRRHYVTGVKKAPVAETNIDKEIKKEPVNPTKTEVNRMPLAELKKFAPTIGISVTDESTGSELKKQIIAKLGL